LKFEHELSFAEYVHALGGALHLVGGAVRDQVMGIEPHDKDYVIVGLDVRDVPFEKIVGTDFPVFLVEVGGKKCEVAMARSEKKSGVGYHGFTFKADKTVSIFDDLARRDLTMNAMAKYILNDKIIDPHNGIADIANGVLRHTTEAFAEDPLRVYRVARFASHLGFRVHPKTLTLMSSMRDELRFLKVERVWKELQKTLETKNPRRFFEILNEANVLDVHFKEIDYLHVADAHDGTTFNHTMNLLNMGDDPIERFGLLVHDLGKGWTGKRGVPYERGIHHGHSKHGEKMVNALCDRLKTPNAYRDFGVICSKYHMRIKYVEMRPAKFLRMVLELKKCIRALLRVSFIDSITRAHNNAEYVQILAWWLDTKDKIELALEIERDVNGNSLIEQGWKPNKHFGEVLFQRRVEAFKERL